MILFAFRDLNISFKLLSFIFASSMSYDKLINNLNYNRYLFKLNYLYIYIWKIFSS